MQYIKTMKNYFVIRYLNKHSGVRRTRQNKSILVLNCDLWKGKIKVH